MSGQRCKWMLVIGLAATIVSCGDPSSPRSNPDPRCQPSDMACLRRASEDAGYTSEIEAVAFASSYIHCLTDDEMRSEIEESGNRRATVRTFAIETAEKPARRAAEAGCLLAVEDLGLL